MQLFPYTPQMSPTKIQAICNKILRNHLPSFIAKSFMTLNPTTPYLHNWHLDLIAEYLNACHTREIKRLIINIPPRSLKSISVSVAFPAWILGHNPAEKVIVASYGQNLSNKHSTDCRNLIMSKWYQSVFPSVQFSSDQNEKHKFVTTKRGHRIATSVGSGITGEGGNFLIVDDPHNPMQAINNTQRRIALDWFDNTFMSRLDDKKNGVVIVVMQRLHTEDLTGYLLAKKTGWEHLCLPAVAEKKTIIDFHNIKIIRQVGDVLHPQREDKLLIEKAKKELGSYAFAGQYQQHPVPLGGGMIKQNWFMRYKSPPANPINIIQSWDTAIKSNKLNDSTVCTTWFETEKGYYLADVLKIKAEYPELKRAVVSSATKYNPSVILIEDKASGQSLLQDLNAETRLPLIGISPTKDKITRVAQISAVIEAGRVFLPENAAWLTDFETEITAFPNATHDDQVDSVSQFLNWIRTRKVEHMVIRRL